MRNSALHTVRNRWRARIFLKCLAWVLLAMLFIIAANKLASPDWYWAFGSISLAIVFIFLELKKLPSQSDLIRLVNAQYQAVEHSTDLLFTTPDNQLHALQQQRANDALKRQLPDFKFPIYWKDLIVASAALFVSLVGARVILENSKGDVIGNSLGSETFLPNETQLASDSVFIMDHRVSVRPPGYTKIRSKNENSLDVSVPEQSLVQWELTFNGTPQAVWMRVNSGDSLTSVQKNGKHQFSLKTLKSSLYTLNYLDDEGRSISSPYYELNVIPDESPEIVVNGIAPFQRLDYEKNLSIDVNVSIADDYGLTDGYIIATITKGAGESVKFREQKIPLPGKVSGRKIVRPVSFDLDKLGMEPGNELYFYVTAFDNREPEVQQSRTDTYFIILKDTAEVEFSLQGALGVDLMPDFFRSQLQIIIDTKKLIEEKGQLSDHDFNFESNALGYDQKQLRLKYGQFIGEEEDSGLEIEEEPMEPSTDGDNVLSEFGHDTDAENEEGQWMDRGTESGHDHDHEEHQEEEENPLEQFLHNHEDEETATFYTQSLKSKLRAALNEMWDAELYLRLYKPKESLPYQLKAQELLKEIRNHARIYVQRIGFDPPPVNVDESRLTGKLEELNDQPFSESVDKEQLFPSIHKAIRLIDRMQFDSVPWDENTKSILKRAGDELAGLAIENPGKYLTTLNQLKSLLERNALADNDISQLVLLRKVLEEAIPGENTLPQVDSRSDDEYTEVFIESLTKSTDR